VNKALTSKDIYGFNDIRDFEMLFKSHYQNLCSYAYLFLKDPDISEDTVQEVFFKLWKNRETIEIDTSVKSYLFRAVRNGCMNVIEHMKVRDGYREIVEGAYYGDNSDSIDQAIVNELEQKIRETIDLLPPERRKIFLMSRYEGLKYREIADELGISVKTVENQMYQALGFMRENLKEYLPLILWLIFLKMGK
jgi:RNA polymerase sigma-70 factor (ECF subfamily)